MDHSANEAIQDRISAHLAGEAPSSDTGQDAPPRETLTLRKTSDDADASPLAESPAQPDSVDTEPGDGFTPGEVSPSFELKDVAEQLGVDVGQLYAQLQIPTTDAATGERRTTSLGKLKDQATANAVDENWQSRQAEEAARIRAVAAETQQAAQLLQQRAVAADRSIKSTGAR